MCYFLSFWMQLPFVSVFHIPHVMEEKNNLSPSWHHLRFKQWLKSTCVNELIGRLFPSQILTSVPRRLTRVTGQPRHVSIQWAATDVLTALPFVSLGTSTMKNNVPVWVSVEFTLSWLGEYIQKALYNTYISKTPTQWWLSVCRNFRKCWRIKDSNRHSSWPDLDIGWCYGCQWLTVLIMKPLQCMPQNIHRPEMSKNLPPLV